MQKLQSQGVHHITINGADRQTSLDFWEDVLGGDANLTRRMEFKGYVKAVYHAILAAFLADQRGHHPAGAIAT